MRARVWQFPDLNHTELATDEDKQWKLDYWARLFKAETWEELNREHDETIRLSYWEISEKAFEEYKRHNMKRNPIKE